MPASESLQYNWHQNLIKASYIFAKLSGSLTVLTLPEEYFKWQIAWVPLSLGNDEFHWLFKTPIKNFCSKKRSYALLSLVGVSDQVWRNKYKLCSICFTCLYWLALKPTNAEYRWDFSASLLMKTARSILHNNTNLHWLLQASAVYAPTNYFDVPLTSLTVLYLLVLLGWYITILTSLRLKH